MNQIGPYAIDGTVPGKPAFLFGHHIGFSSDQTLLIKTSKSDLEGNRLSEKTPRSRLVFREEAALLSRLTIPNSRLIDVGRDERLDLDYYAMLVPGRFEPVSFDQHPEGKRLQLLLLIAIAVQELNRSGIAYRNFIPAAFGLLGTRILVYDFARATRVGTDRLRTLPIGYESFDPPESRRGPYDLLKGEIFGIGHLMVEARLEGMPSRRFAKRLMDPNPDERPTIEDVIGSLRSWRF